MLRLKEVQISGKIRIIKKIQVFKISFLKYFMNFNKHMTIKQSFTTQAYIMNHFNKYFFKGKASGRFNHYQGGHLQFFPHSFSIGKFQNSCTNANAQSLT